MARPDEADSSPTNAATGNGSTEHAPVNRHIQAVTPLPWPWHREIGRGVSTCAQVAVLAVLNEQITTLNEAVVAHFRAHPDAEIVLSQPGLDRSLVPGGSPSSGTIRYTSVKARKNFAGTSPITRQSGKRKTVLARYVHNDRLLDALTGQAFTALKNLP